MFAYWRQPRIDLAVVILRLGLGFIFIAHGAVKISQSSVLSDAMSYRMQTTIGWAELICGGLLVLGLLTRLAALVLVADMIGAIALVTGSRDFIAVEVGPHGFTYRAGGFEYNIALIVGFLALALLGSGWFSLDHLLFGRNKQTSTAAPATGAPPALTQEPIISSKT
jgi:putative oxidoreductase